MSPVYRAARHIRHLVSVKLPCFALALIKKHYSDELLATYPNYSVFIRTVFSRHSEPCIIRSVHPIHQDAGLQAVRHLLVHRAGKLTVIFPAIDPREQN